ncbi:hypothetical protein VRRI112168_02880 [Vreelandella rituensis]|uniref:Uncharacterized protein n=1 Tax=Vreelandella rituensis TaxID=2282306 RepID=A0A368U908_9GAMM|nr:hypothetical protein [Halomonas rituensis]RCV93688.1 hypothetical protein DU506_00600 [Halomonas rituensis]
MIEAGIVIDQEYTGKIVAYLNGGVIKEMQRSLGLDGLTLNQYAAHPAVQNRHPTGLMVVDEAAYLVEYRRFIWRHYLCHSPVPVTEEKYMEMLEILTPDAMGQNDEHGDHWFLMSEHLRENITTMYACKDGLYLEKNVDATNRLTWITRKHFDSESLVAID